VRVEEICHVHQLACLSDPMLQTHNTRTLIRTLNEIISYLPSVQSTLAKGRIAVLTPVAAVRTFETHFIRSTRRSRPKTGKVEDKVESGEVKG